MANFDEELDQIISSTSDLSVISNSPVNSNNSFLCSLSEEFDMLGLPLLDLKQPLIKILQQVADNTHSLIHIHRKVLTQMKDVNINNKQRCTRNYDLERKITDLHLELKSKDTKNRSTESNLLKLSNECTELKKKVCTLENETRQLKRYHKGKQKELVHHINSLKNENEHLKELCKLKIGTYRSKDETIAEVLGNYKRNEEIYKSTIRKLESCNSGVVTEILNLKEQLAYSTESK